MWEGALIAAIMPAGLGVWRAVRRGPSRDGNARAPYMFADDGSCSPPSSTTDCVDSDGGGD